MKKVASLQNFLSIILLILFSVSIARAESPSKIPAQLAINILQKPTPMLAADKDYLVYELYVTNFQTFPITLTALEVKGTNAQDKKFQFAGTELADMIHPVSDKLKDMAPFIFAPGTTKLIFVWLPYDHESALPDHLAHKITYTQQEAGNAAPLSVTTDPLKLEKYAPVIISPPLKGNSWLAGNAPSNTSEHRKAHMVMNGHDYFSQRYAIDFIQLDPNGQSYHGDEHKNQSYIAYAKNILSVAPGKVVAIKDGIPENTPHSGQTAVPIDIETVGGNYVVVDIGNNNYAFYAHLIPGTLTVKVGDQVTSGQVLGKLGNTGNSSEPHLHFHVVNKPDFIAAEGVPYAFDSFEQANSKVIATEPEYKLQNLPGSKPVKNQLVLENTIMNFGD